MTTALPPPPVPADADLRDFAFMPLDVLRLRDSDLAAVATGDEFKAAVLLWCAAWHQVPAGSLPDDDRWLARHSGAGPKWHKVRGEALRGYFKACDGRLYHSVIAEKVNEAIEKKASHRLRTLKARISALEKRLKSATDQEDRADLARLIADLKAQLPQTEGGSVTDSRVVYSTDTKGQGQGQGQGYESRSPSENDAPGESPAREPPPEEPDPSPDPAALIFVQGLRWLVKATGKPEAQCRSILGRWRRDAKTDANLIEILGAAQRHGPIDAIEWISAAIRSRNTNGTSHPHGNQPRRRSAAANAAAFIAGLGGSGDRGPGGGGG